MLNLRNTVALATLLAVLALAVTSHARASRYNKNAPIVQGTGAPATAVYQLDPAHSIIGFSVRHLTINNVIGRFKDFTGKINYDAADITRSSVEFTAKVASVDTGVAQRDEHLRTADFFEVEKYPEMTFKSSKVERKGQDAYVAYGTFTLHGVSKEIAIPFKLFGPIKDPWGKQRLGVEAGLTINRQDYGVKYNRLLEGGGLVVSNDVQINLLLEAAAQ